MIASAGVLYAAALSACASMMPFTSSQQKKTVGFEVSSRVSTVVIKGLTGEIEVSDGDQSGVDVTETYTYHSTPPDATHTIVDGVLTLAYSCAGTDQDCGVDFRVLVPAGTAVQISAGTGDITLSSLTGSVQARTSTGEISGDHLAAPHVDLSSGTGDVRADFDQSPASVAAVVSTGNVSLSLPGGARYAVHAQASTGDVHVSVPEDPGSADSVTATAGTGNVTVAVG